MANLLSFPKGIGTGVKSGQPYMLLTSYESKNAIESTGQVSHAGSDNYNPGIAKSSIALYIPPNSLKTEFAATWEETAGAATKAAMLGQGVGETGIGDMLLAAGKGAAVSIGGTVATQFDKGTGMLAAQGLAVNNHMALTYKGPTTMRQHSFAFKFFPKNVDEANAIKDILKDLENGMLPRMGWGDMQKVKGRTLSAPLFKAPRHWTIDFFMKGTGQKGGDAGNTYLFKIKKSVITAMSINHDPNSTISFHNDGSPVETDLALTFKEIELPISSDTNMQ